MEHDAITLLHDAVLRGEEMLRQATGFRELAGSTVVSGESGNGSVVVHVNALGWLRGIDVSDRAARFGSAERIGELIVEALTRAEDAAREAKAGLYVHLGIAAPPDVLTSDLQARGGSQ